MGQRGVVASRVVMMEGFAPSTAAAAVEDMVVPPLSVLLKRLLLRLVILRGARVEKAIHAHFAANHLQTIQLPD